MRRIATLTAVLAISCALAVGCSPVTRTAPSAPSASDSAGRMPEVTVVGEVNPLTRQQNDELKAGSVSAAVHALTVHGCASVVVVGRDGHEMPESMWDAHAVLEITLDADTALLVVG